MGQSKNTKSKIDTKVKLTERGAQAARDHAGSLWVSQSKSTK